MNLTKIKLVVSDMDGTLLNSKGQVSKGFYTLFKKLKKENIEFVAASGRQYYSIADKLKPIAEDIFIIAENGGIAKKGNKTYHCNYFPNEIVFDLITLLRKIDHVYPVICGEKKAYIETKDQNFIELLSEYYSEYELVDDLLQITEDNFFKIAIYHFESSEEYIYPYVKHLHGDIQVKISGKHWVDLSHLDTHKGNALKKLQEKLNISENETMVFGDYNNDLEMMKLAYFSYAMENAHPNIKAEARFQTKSNDEDGVELVLRQLLQTKQLENGTL